MVIVLGNVLVQEGKMQQALALSLEHVRRSRAEPGCVAHGVHLDAEDPNRLVFVEEWADQAALQQHFKVPESRAFVKALAALAVGAPGMALYEASRVAL